MIKSQRKKQKLTAEINVVPYIDVMLVLLVIFMATAPFITQGVDVSLPKTSTAAPMQDQNRDELSFIIIEVAANGSLGLSVNNEEMQRNINLQDLIVYIKAELLLNTRSPIALGGDANSSYAQVVEVLDELNKAGIEKIGLLTDIKAD